MYKNGFEFVRDLHQKYGLLEASRMATDYLLMQKDVADEKENEFCKEVSLALHKLDQI